MDKALYNKFIVLLTSRLLQTNSSSTTSDCNLADNIGRTEEQNNIDGRSSVVPTIMKLSDDTMQRIKTFL
jgi:hypothetical protein